MANMDFFGFFDYMSGDDDKYEYSSDEFSMIIDALTSSGVCKNVGQSFAATASAAGLDLTIGSGECFINGRYAKMNGATAFTVTPTTGQRYDRVIARMSFERRVIELVIVEGTATAAPELINTSITQDLPLYTLKVSNEGNYTIVSDDRTLIVRPNSITAEIAQVANIANNKANKVHTHKVADISDIVVSATEPTSPTTGMLWLKI